MLTKSKIPVRDLTPMFNTMEQQQSHRSRREMYSASFNPPNAVDEERDAVKNKYHEKLQKSHEKMRELKNLLNAKDTEINGLKATVTELYEQNGNLLKDKSILIDNFNSLTEKFGADEGKRQFEVENSELKNDIKMLKILVFRLNKHIEYYQFKLNEKCISFEAPTKYSDEENSSAWAVHSNILSPLIDSYEERIKEKNNIIKSYEAELNQFSIKATKIAEENERIQELYENQCKSTEMWKTEKQRLSSQCELLKNKATIHAKRADLAKEKLYDVLKVYEQKMQSQSLDIERLQEAYNRSKGEIATLKSFQKNPEVVTEHVKECQNILEQLKTQFEVEKSQMIDEQIRMETQLSSYKDRVSELDNLLEKQKLCNEAYHDKNKLLKKALHQERSTLQSYENEVKQFREHGHKTWQNISDLQSLIQEKELQIQNLLFSHKKEIEVYQLKLQQRDYTMKKLLETKISQSSTKC